MFIHWHFDLQKWWCRSDGARSSILSFVGCSIRRLLLLLLLTLSFWRLTNLLLSFFGAPNFNRLLSDDCCCCCCSAWFCRLSLRERVCIARGLPTTLLGILALSSLIHLWPSHLGSLRRTRQKAEQSKGKELYREL